MPDSARAVLLDALHAAQPGEYAVTLLPDFFLDHFVTMPPIEQTLEAVQSTHAQGGGGIQVSRQRLAPGGNAANTASALARLGLRAHLITVTSPFGLGFLHGTLGREGVQLSRVRDDGDVSLATALEFPNGNVMLITPGSLADFGPEHLETDDWALIKESDAVLMSNWVNRRATELATEVMRRAQGAGTRTYVDTGDPCVDHVDHAKLLRNVVLSTDLVVLAVNHVEATHHAREAGVYNGRDAVEAACALSTHMEARLDLHTKSFSASMRDGHVAAIAPTFQVKPRRSTGAGDTWNAGNLLGTLLGLPDEQRLLLANATAAAYVSAPGGLHPTLEDLSTFVESTPLKPLQQAPDAVDAHTRGNR